jgi:hypothetical protein
MNFPLNKKYTYPQLPIGEKVKIVEEMVLRNRTERDILRRSNFEEDYRQLFFAADDETYIISRELKECTLVTKKRVFWNIPLYLLQSSEEERTLDDLHWAINPRGKVCSEATYKTRTREQAELVVRELEAKMGVSHEILPIAAGDKKGLYLL